MEIDRKGTKEMYDRLAILNLVADAQRGRPYCACGAIMRTVERDGALWHECSSPRPSTDARFARLRSMAWDAWHERELILATEEALAA